MKNPVLIALLCAPIALLSGCLTSGGGNTSESIPPGFKSASFAYSLEEGKIIVPQSTRTIRECTDSGLATETSTLLSTAIPYELDGDSLKLMLGSPQTISIGTVVQIYNIHVRVGRGSGLTGRWLLTGQRYRMVSGETTAEEKDRFDRMMASADMMRPFTDVHHLISGDSISTFMDTKNAELFISEWNGLFSERPEDADSAIYDISLRVIEKDVVELKGLKTGETVRLRMGNDRSRDFSSDAPGHAPHHYDDTPESCPNGFSPEWYQEFLHANRSVIPQ